jgi:hypothetical protein
MPVVKEDPGYGPISAAEVKCIIDVLLVKAENR